MEEVPFTSQQSKKRPLTESTRASIEDPLTFQQSKKRPLQQFQDSPFYKMRVVLSDLRPHFIQVLKTPDFRNCSAAEKIREGMKLMMDLYQEIITESVTLEKCTVPNYSCSDTGDGQKPVELQENAKSTENALPEGEGPTTIAEHQVEGTYIVGGSAFGWNFITFLGSKSVYYGRTKESFRAASTKPDQ